MSKERACKICNFIHTESKCPKCGAKEYTESFKGKIIILDPEKSEFAKKLNITEKGEYAIKTK